MCECLIDRQALMQLEQPPPNAGINATSVVTPGHMSFAQDSNSGVNRHPGLKPAAPTYRSSLPIGMAMPATPQHTSWSPTRHSGHVDAEEMTMSISIIAGVPRASALVWWRLVRL